MYRVLQAALTVLMISTFASTSVTAKATVCESTGPRCKTTDQCATLADGMYQWCGGCEKNLRCQAGVGELFDYYNPSYTQWDDNSKNFEASSTTCIECHYPCPPGPYEPECSVTGMGCVAYGLCPVGANGNIQYCKNCTHYVQCTYGADYRLVACPEGLYYDDSVRTCVPQSTTCVHCYNPSNCHSQETTTAGVMWTTAGMMTTASSATTTTHASPSSECTCTCTCGTKCN